MSEEGMDAGDISAEEIAEAKALGWKEASEWKGDISKHIDARTFLEKGKHILPFVQANAKRLGGEVESLQAQLRASQEAIKAANTAIAALEESHAADVAEQVEAARRDIKAQLAAASRDGDHEQVAELTDKLTQLNTADKDAGGDGEGKDDKPPAPQLHPEAIAWYRDNVEFVQDPRRMALANAESILLRQEGDKSVGKEFLEKVAQRVETILGGARKAGKVEGGNGGTGRGSDGGGTGKTYADLPAEAKKACDKLAARLVGPNRAHKDIASWRKSYATQYFQE